MSYDHDSPGRAIFEQLQRVLEQQAQDGGFGSLDEARDAMQAQLEQASHRAEEDFEGLTPGQMHPLLYHPFESEHLVTFGGRLEACPQTAATRLLKVIAEHAGEKGIKLTPKGNFPLKVVHDAYGRLEAEGLLCDRGPPPGYRVNNEDDFPELITFHNAAELGRLLRKANGRIKPTRAVERPLARGEWGVLYRHLLYSYARKFNWGYLDRFPELNIIQTGLAFTLYLLHRYGGEPRPASFYADAFLRAFPQAIDEMAADPLPLSGEPEDGVRYTWYLRTIVRTLMPLGLVAIDRGANDAGDGSMRPGLSLKPRIRRTDLCGQVVRWHT